MKISNEELVRLYKETRDEKYLNQLLKACKHLAIYACKRVQKSDQADALQECLFSAWQSLETYDPTKGKFSTYVCGRFRFVIWDFIKKLPRNQVPFVDLSSHSPRFGTENDVRAYLDLIPDHQSTLILEYLIKGSLKTRSDRSQKSAGLKQLRTLAGSI